MFRSIERSLIYPAPPVERGAWDTNWIQKEDVYFESPNGVGRAPVRLHGWFLEHPAPKSIVLYAHGQSEHVGRLVNVVARLQESLQASVFAFDYRGYGKSEGVPTEAGCIADGLAAQQWLAERTGSLPEEIVVLGRSLGGAVAVAVAAERGARALVLENTFSRLTDVASYRFPWLPVKALMSTRYHAIDWIRGYDGPLFQLHGTRDRVAPAKFARDLFAACPSEMKRFYIQRGGRHHDAPPLAFFTRLEEFLAEVDERNAVLTPDVLYPAASGELSAIS